MYGCSFTRLSVLNPLHISVFHLSSRISGTNVYICGFHLEQAWDRKITPKETGVQIHQKPDVKAMLRQIAFAL